MPRLIVSKMRVTPDRSEERDAHKVHSGLTAELTACIAAWTLHRLYVVIIRLSSIPEGLPWCPVDDGQCEDVRRVVGDDCRWPSGVGAPMTGATGRVDRSINRDDLTSDNPLPTYITLLSPHARQNIPFIHHDHRPRRPQANWHCRRLRLR